MVFINQHNEGSLRLFLPCSEILVEAIPELLLKENSVTE